MSIIEFILNHIFRSIFLKGDVGFRNASLIAKVVFFASALTVFTLIRDYRIALLLYATVIILGLIDKGFEWCLSSTITSLIPALWFTTTTYILALAGLLSGISIIGLITIFTRTLSFGVLMLFTLSIVNPVEIYNLLYRLGYGKYSCFPLLLWRLIPYGLINTIESLGIARVKKERFYKRMASAMASIMELGDYTRVYSYWKIYNEPRHVLPIAKSLKHDLALILHSLLYICLTITRLINLL